MRRRFVLVSLAVTAVVVTAFAAPLAWVIKVYAYDRALSAAEREVAAVTTVLAVTGDDAEIRRAVASTESGRAHRLVVHVGGDTVGTGGWAEPADVAGARSSGAARTVAVDGGVAHLRPTQTLRNGTAVVEILVPDATLRDGVDVAWAALATGVVLLLAASALLTDRLARSAVRATTQLAAAAGRLGEGDLNARVRPDGPPEIATVGAAFNVLAGRFADLLAGERELVADLSHRLRTPLTALRLGVEALPGGTERDRLLNATDSMEREVDEVIERARRPLGGAPPGRCDLRAVVAERVAYWSVLADDQGRAWSLDSGEAPVPVAVPEAELESALDSLLGNIFRHTGEGVRFAVALTADDGTAAVTVDDAGGGIADDPERGHSEHSTGLGLSIARRVARSAGGDLTIGAGPLGGARISLVLPRVESPRP